MFCKFVIKDVSGVMSLSVAPTLISFSSISLNGSASNLTN